MEVLEGRVVVPDERVATCRKTPFPSNAFSLKRLFPMSTFAPSLSRQIDRCKNGSKKDVFRTIDPPAKHFVSVSDAMRNAIFFGVFPMFVPSLSW